MLTKPLRKFGTLGPATLMLVTGTLVGLKFPLGKVAGNAGIAPMMWSLIIAMGATLMLLPPLLVQRRLSRPRGPVLRYMVISGLVSSVIPNLLLFSVIPKAGAGYTGLMFALSPVFTMSLAALLKLERPTLPGLVGIALGLLGAAIVCVTRGTGIDAPPLLWLLGALLVPMALAVGNIYRTIDWPKEATPDELAFWSNGFSTGCFLLLILLSEHRLSLEAFALAPWAALTQMVFAGLTFPFYFRLQLKGGPVLLSQLGYVAAAVGLWASTVFLGEHYRLITWLGAGVIALGIAVTVLTQVKGTAWWCNLFSGEARRICRAGI